MLGKHWPFKFIPYIQGCEWEQWSMLLSATAHVSFAPPSCLQSIWPSISLHHTCDHWWTLQLSLSTTPTSCGKNFSIVCSYWAVEIACIILNPLSESSAAPSMGRPAAQTNTAKLKVHKKFIWLSYSSSGSCSQFHVHVSFRIIP